MDYFFIVNDDEIYFCCEIYFWFDWDMLFY